MHISKITFTFLFSTFLSISVYLLIIASQYQTSNSSNEQVDLEQNKVVISDEIDISDKQQTNSSKDIDQPDIKTKNTSQEIKSNNTKIKQTIKNDIKKKRKKKTSIQTDTLVTQALEPQSNKSQEDQYIQESQIKQPQNQQDANIVNQTDSKQLNKGIKKDKNQKETNQNKELTSAQEIQQSNQQNASKQANKFEINLNQNQYFIIHGPFRSFDFPELYLSV